MWRLAAAKSLYVHIFKNNLKIIKILYDINVHVVTIWKTEREREQYDGYLTFKKFVLRHS